MKKSKVSFILTVLLVMIITMTACGKKSESMNTSASIASEGGTSSANDQVTFDSFEANGTGKADTADTTNTAEKDGKTAAELANSSALSTDSLQAQSNDKIIKHFNLEVETKDFDNLIKKLNDKINSLGGYVESSSISGESYNENNVTRDGNIVARIPSKKTDEFVSTVSKSANVTNNTCTTENVTLKYIDAQSRIDALKIEQERLFAILEKADDLDSIITLESRLSDIRYELQNYQSQLRSYDNEVEYSTVNLNIQEVERITPVTEKKATFTDRIKTGFSNTIYHIGEGFKNFLIWFIVNLPYFLIWGIIIFAAVIIGRKAVRRSNTKKAVAIPPVNNGENSNIQQNQVQENDGRQDSNQKNIK